MQNDCLIWYEKPELKKPYMLIAFTGWANAGDVPSSVEWYIIDTMSGCLFAELKPESFYTYQSNDVENKRPLVNIEDGMVSSLKLTTTNFWYIKNDNEEHDIIIGAIMQNARTIVLETYARLLEKNGVDFGKFYDMSSPPAKTILELISKQIAKESDEMYNDMNKFNPYQKKIDKEIEKCLKEVIKKGHKSESLRKSFGKNLKRIQENAKKRLWTVN